MSSWLMLYACMLYLLEFSSYNKWLCLLYKSVLLKAFIMSTMTGA